MKIVCDSCGTKYSISDDKVRGKVFKIRCKKCSHIIVVRGTNEAAAAAAPAAAAPADAGGWHLVVDGDQVGPVSEADIRGRIERGEVNAETYVWKEGFADWLKLSAIPELAGLVQPADGGVFADGTGSGGVGSGRVNGEGASRQSGPVAAGGLFGGAPMGDEADVFGSPAAAAKRGGGGDLFASPAVVSKPAPEESRWPAASSAPAGHDGGRVENLTGQRHENSVLFSLSNLQSLAMPAPASSKPSLSTSAPTSEGSGLIDIRAMAATTLGSSGGGSSFGGGPADDLPAFGSFSPAAPVLLALPTSSGPSKWVYIGIAAIGVLLIGVIAMAVMVFGSKPVTTVAAPAATAVAPGAPAAAPSAPVAANAPAAAPSAPTQIPANELPPRAEAPKPAEAAPAAAKGEHEHHHHGKDSGGSSKKAGGDDGKKASAPAAAAPVAAAPPPEKKPAKGSLDDLLEGALQHKPAAAAPKPRADDSGGSASAGGGPLAKSAVVAGMNSVKGKISDCYQQFKVPGMAMVNVVIGKNGRVSSATCTGKFAGTPTGTCVEKAVKSATFPPSDGLSTPYPFQLK
jgi:predicted Zn finger-like uncharacterized protein